ncbi:MAG: 7-carboxy-7-deazaguanine synthase QueE [Candidatus Eisenbacteria bacterium]|nr:7-carboxy-7-deazaguanine synthase QueE [Candidatus Eisenbacteria bacterium]
MSSGVDLRAAQLQVTEIFHSIQGESTRAGWPCVFVRLTGCPLRCTYCDTAYAFHGGKRWSIARILEEVARYTPRLVEVTGGEPLAQSSAPLLLRALADAGYHVLLETAGSEDIRPVDSRVRIIYDVKTPGSGEAESNRWENLNFLKPEDEIKFVVASRADYEWTREVIRERDLARERTVHLSPVFGRLDAQELAGWILADRLPVRLNLQIHKFIWDPEARGV